MNKSTFEHSLRGFSTVLCAVLLLLAVGARAQDKATPVQDQLPQKVMEGLKARFPKAEIDKWTKEKEGDLIVYDIEFTQVGQKCEADIKGDGTIHNWEKAIAVEDLPAAVVKAVGKAYPKSTIKEVMQVTAVKNGKDELEGYEIGLQTAEKKSVEVTVAQDGKILEDSGAKK